MLCLLATPNAGSEGVPYFLPSVLDGFSDRMVSISSAGDLSSTRREIGEGVDFGCVLSLHLVGRVSLRRNNGDVARLIVTSGKNFFSQNWHRNIGMGGAAP